MRIQNIMGNKYFKLYDAKFHAAELYPNNKLEDREMKELHSVCKDRNVKLALLIQIRTMRKNTGTSRLLIWLNLAGEIKILKKSRK